MMPDLSVVVLREQHPVGHGFFHACVLQSTQDTFRYVYDCGGGRNIEAEVDAYLTSLGSDKIDLLFLSHLHADHVSGLPRLLSRAKVRRAIIPHLSQSERLLICLRNAVRGSLNVDTALLALQPRDWLEGHGVAEVIEVQHSDGGRNIQEPYLRNDGNGPPWETKLVYPDGRVGASDDNSWPKTIDDRHQVVTRTQNLVWVLNPYVRSAAPGQVDELTRALGKLAAFDPSALISRFNLATMRKAFKTVWRDINWTSLCLASTPHAAGKLLHVCVVRSEGSSFSEHAEQDGMESSTGWLGLGDAVLADTNEVAMLAKHLGPDVLKRINTHSLPHHGSADNFCPELLRLVSHPHLLRYATAKHESTKHPAPRVRQEIAALGLKLWLVTEHAGSRLTERIVYHFE